MPWSHGSSSCWNSFERYYGVVIRFLTLHMPPPPIGFSWMSFECLINGHFCISHLQYSGGACVFGCPPFQLLHLLLEWYSVLRVQSGCTRFASSIHLRKYWSLSTYKYVYAIYPCLDEQDLIPQVVKHLDVDLLCSANLVFKLHHSLCCCKNLEKPCLMVNCFNLLSVFNWFFFLLFLHTPSEVLCYKNNCQRCSCDPSASCRQSRVTWNVACCCLIWTIIRCTIQRTPGVLWWWVMEGYWIIIPCQSNYSKGFIIVMLIFLIKSSIPK